MAEKQCNLLKNGGGNGVKLRKTVTNSGSQSRGTLLYQFRTDIVSYLDSGGDIDRLYIKTISASGTILVFKLNRTSADRGCIQLNNLSGNYAGNSFYIYCVHISTESSSVYSASIAVGGNWGTMSDSSSATDWATLELYY